jgi:5'-nucleotidase
MGVCNFKAKVDQLRKENPYAITLFSGDCFSPSTLTNIKGGGQMVYALNEVGIDCACFGNHEFDLEHDKTLKLARECNWPWLLGNIKYTLTG